MISKKILFIVFGLIASNCLGQDMPFAGTWSGLIEIPGSPLDVEVSFGVEENEYVGNIDIPMQNAEDLPIEVTEIDGQDIEFVINDIPGNPLFRGTLKDSAIEGIFLQNEQEFPFALSQEEIGQSESETQQNLSESEVSPEKILELLFTETPARSGWFTESFLNQVPITQVEETLEQIRNDLGEYQSAQLDEDVYVLQFLEGTVTAEITLNAEGKISRLRFTDVSTSFEDLDDVVKRIEGLSGTTSLLVIKNDEVIADIESDKPLAVGSTFKIAVMAALLKSEIDLSAVHLLESEWISLPSGELQKWPQDSPVTVSTLAAFMISESDNTATEALMDILGSQALQEFAGNNSIILSPNQIFKLKFSGNSNLTQKYAESNVRSQREILTELDTVNLPKEIILENPVAIDSIEWFYSARKLCQMMKQVQEHPIMSINTGVANTNNWSHIAFKGGSEPGVFNLTTWLESEEASFCVSFTQNDSANVLDENLLISLYSGILNVLN